MQPGAPEPARPDPARPDPARPDPARIAFLSGHVYAHRGLHCQNGPIENSLPAFAAALDAGHGAECDVRLSADGIVHVFHDKMLDRLTDARGPLNRRSAADLAHIMLNDAGGPVPRLSALLTLIAGRAPLLIEIKIDHRREIPPLCLAVAQDLRDYAGPVAIMSFHPDVVRWFRRFAPHFVRGLVVTEDNRKGPISRALRHLAIQYARPDFLAYDIRDLPSRCARYYRTKGYPVLSWTVRTPEQWGMVSAEADAAIFEGRADGRD